MFVERDLGAIGPHVEASLQAHFESCASCAAWASTERRLTADLALLRSAAPFEIDVTSRVARDLAGLRPAREEVSTRQLGWAVAAAVACGAGLLVGLWALVPGLARAASGGRALFTSLRHAFAGVADAIITIAATGFGLLGDLVSSLAVASSGLQPLVPAAIAVVALGWVMMGTTVIVVVGRDIKKATWIRGER
jgi:hypothetical protein